MSNLFAYGTLMHPEIMTQVSGSPHDSSDATLPDYIRKSLKGEVYPAIIEHVGATVEGVLYFDIAPDAFCRLDKFEGPLYVRTGVVVIDNGGKRLAAQTYVLNAAQADRLSNEDWSFDTFLNGGKGAFQSTYQGFRKLD